MAAAREAAGHALAAKALLLHKASELGLAGTPQPDAAGRPQTDEAALIQALFDAELSIAVPSEADCRQFYEAHRDRFRGPMLYEAAHILVEPRSPDAAGETDAEAAAERLVAVLAKQPDQFAALARVHSTCPSGAVGGSLGQLVAGDLAPELEAVLARLAPGEIAAAPVRTRFGWHVLKLVRRIDGVPVPFESVSGSIRAHLEERGRAHAAARYLVQLSEEARSRRISIELNEAGHLAGEPVCLGEFLGDADASARLLPWLDEVDADLARRIRSEAHAAGLETENFVRQATAQFVDSATDEHWTQVLSATRDTPDPAVAALGAILRRASPAVRKVTTIFPRRATG